jgi:uncharacterized protein YbjT (DUF2867 family)
MKVFLTGATGFVGRHVAARLIKDGHQVKCVVRRPDSPEAEHLAGIGAEIAPGDILDAESLAGAAAGSEAVIHLVGIIFEHRGISFENIHVHGTYNALAAASVVGARRFLHMSALGTGPDAVSAYHRTKWAAEETVRASGLDYTILRPSIIYGRGGEFIHMLMSQIKILPLVPVVGKGRYLMQPVTAVDVAACFSACLARKKTIGQAYEIGGPEQFSYNEMIDRLSWAMNKHRYQVHIPVFLVRPVAWLSERIQKQPMLTVDQLNMLLEDNVCDTSRMVRELGVKPLPFEEGLKEVLAKAKQDE